MARLVVVSNILNNSRQETLNNRRNERRMMRYTEKAFLMSDEEFVGNYRITKDLFEEVYEIIRPYMPTPKRRSEISPKYKLQILVALSFYATGSYQRLVGGNYGTLMSQQSVSRAIRDVTAALNHPQIVKSWIKFPQTHQERVSVQRRFFEKYHIPSVLGCIDGTHIAIIRPKDNEERFFNRKHFHSRNVMIISDADLRILSVDASFGGATHDSFVWNQHPIKQHIVNLNNCGESVFLLGDSGYAQREYLMTPIVDAVEGSPEEFYNKLHCSVRSTVERTIGVLKNRWRCLLGHRVLHYHPDTAAKIINACCVLHNMCINRLDFNIEETTEELQNQTQSSQQSSMSTSTAELRRGLEKRTILVQQLWTNRQ